MLPLRWYLPPDMTTWLGIGKSKQPVGGVKPVDHQVAQGAVSEIPDPAPVSHAQWIERLVGSVSEEAFPVYLIFRDLVLRIAPKRTGVAAPLHVYTSHFPGSISPESSFCLRTTRWGMVRCWAPTCTFLPLRLTASMSG